jgi:hypothetical protein
MGRRCSGCQEFKDPTEFTRNKATRDGLSVYCRDCWAERNRRYKEKRAMREGRVISHRAPNVAAPEGMKHCPDCATIKPLDDFVRNRSTASGYGPYCKPCQNARARESRERLHGGSRHYHLKRRYGIGADEFDRLFAEQRGLCAICHEDPAEHVDHDHETGAVRGLLCFTCNVGLGNFKDDVVRILSAADYLEGYMYFGGIGGDRTGAA